MGRGRAKAKQTKVARALKYSTHNLDLERLERELSGSPTPDGEAARPRSRSAGRAEEPSGVSSER